MSTVRCNCEPGSNKLSQAEVNKLYVPNFQVCKRSQQQSIKALQQQESLYPKDCARSDPHDGDIGSATAELLTALRRSSPLPPWACERAFQDQPPREWVLRQRLEYCRILDEQARLKDSTISATQKTDQYKTEEW
eukprot:2158310-Amphidinium_carterae.1